MTKLGSVTLIIEKERIKFTDGMYGWVIGLLCPSPPSAPTRSREWSGKANMVPLALECSRTHTKADDTTGELEEKVDLLDFWPISTVI